MKALYCILIGYFLRHFCNRKLYSIFYFSNKQAYSHDSIFAFINCQGGIISRQRAYKINGTKNKSCPRGRGVYCVLLTNCNILGIVRLVVGCGTEQEMHRMGMDSLLLLQFYHTFVKKTSTLGTWRPIEFNVLRCMNND